MNVEKVPDNSERRFDLEPPRQEMPQPNDTEDAKVEGELLLPPEIVADIPIFQIGS